jgi:GT2 family glycosyltransferase
MLAQMAAAIAAGRTVIWCDWPLLDGEACADEHLHVYGWAHCVAGLAGVSVLAGGRRFEARTDLPRPDVDGSLPGFDGHVCGFLVVLDTRHWSAGSYELTVRARGRGGGEAARFGRLQVGPDLPYRVWLRELAQEEGSETELARIPGRAGISLTVHVLEAPDAPSGGVERSLAGQTSSDWRRSAGSLGEALQAVAAGGDPAVLVEDRGTLAPRALARLGAAMSAASAPDLIYADEDAMMADGERGDAFFKPGWSPELLLGTDYVGPLVAIGPGAAGAALAAEPQPPRTIYETLLRLIDAPLNVERIPEMLFTCDRPRVAADDAGARKAIECLAARRGRRAQPVALERRGARDVRWELGEEPLVSVVIPSASDELLARCLLSLRERTTYRSLELVIVDSKAGGLCCVQQLLDGVSHRVVPYAGRFRFSPAINAGAAAASGEHLVLLNDDTEVRSPDWVERMLEHSLTPEVGVVGCKLLYPGGTVQHAGVVIAPGGVGAGHINVGFPGDAPGYRGILDATRNASAVTGACMMVSSRLYAQLDGFDESFDSEYSDVDLCLRAIERGRRVVWTPRAVLIHHERSSLPMQVNARDQQRFGERWSSRYQSGDPFYHPAFLPLSYELPRSGRTGF